MSLPERKTLAVIGENLAACYLSDQGYQIIGRNHHTARGEIDIIAVRDTELIFVEVKARSGSIADAENAVTLTKQKKITLSALKFLEDNPSFTEYNCRFDAVFVLYDKQNDSYRINHLTNAFYPAWNAVSDI